MTESDQRGLWRVVHRATLASLCALGAVCVAACESAPEPPAVDDVQDAAPVDDEQDGAPEPETVEDVVPEVAAPDVAPEVGPEVVQEEDAAPDAVPAEPLAVDLTSVPEAPERLFRVVPAEQFNGPPISTSIAIADFNGDRRPDIFVPGRPPMILHNQGDAGFTAEELDLEWPLMMLSCSAMDVDSDGRVDVVVGSDEHIRVAFHKADGWEMGPEVPTVADGASPGFTFVPDFDGDGRSDAAVVAQYGWPPGLPAFNRGLLGQEDNHVFGDNTLLYIGKNGQMESLPLSEYAPKEVSDCANTMSWLSLFLPRHRWGLPGVVWTGNECTDDCWTPYDPQVRLLTGLIPGEHQGSENGTMGGDYWIEEDGIIVGSSQFAGRDPNIWMLPWEGEVQDVSDRLVRTHYDGYDLTWGINFENNYMLVASGERIFQDPEFQEMFESMPGSLAHLTSPGRLLIFPRDHETGEFVQDQDLMPPELDEVGRFHIASGDFFGNDGFGDGCPDAIITPMYYMPAVETFDLPNLLDNMTFMGVNTMLLNTCILDGDNQFVGIDLPATGWAVGAIVEMTTASGKVFVRSSRSTSGVGGSRDPRVILPATAEDPPAEVRIFYASGVEEVLVAPELGIYHQVDGPL